MFCTFRHIFRNFLHQESQLISFAQYAMYSFAVSILIADKDLQWDSPLLVCPHALNCNDFGNSNLVLSGWRFTWDWDLFKNRFTEAIYGWHSLLLFLLPLWQSGTWTCNCNYCEETNTNSDLPWVIFIGPSIGKIVSHALIAFKFEWLASCS